MGVTIGQQHARNISYSNTLKNVKRTKEEDEIVPTAAKGVTIGILTDDTPTTIIVATIEIGTIVMGIEGEVGVTTEGKEEKEVTLAIATHAEEKEESLEKANHQREANNMVHTPFGQTSVPTY